MTKIARGRALVTLPDVATPSDSGRRLRSLSTVVGLSGRYDLDVVLPLSGVAADDSPLPTEAAVRRWVAFAPRDLTTPQAVPVALRGRLPWTLAHQDWSDVRSRLAEWTAAETYDLIWFGAISHSLSLEGVLRAARTVVDLDDVESVKWEGFLAERPAGVKDALEWTQRRIELPLWRRIERRAARAVDVAIISDPADGARCAEIGFTNTHVVPNSYPDPGLLTSTAGRGAPVLALVANFAHGPNREAAESLVEQILPALRLRLPGSRVRLIGRSAESIAHLAGHEGVDLVGPVDDVAPHLADVTATLLPIRFGGGTRLKALEAFALGIPVISTEVGVAGLGAVAGISFLRAETPQEFADRTSQLVEDAGLAGRLTEAARALYERRFTTRSSSDAIGTLVGAWS